MLKNVAKKKIKIKKLQKKKKKTSNRTGFKIGAYSDKSSLFIASWFRWHIINKQTV